MTTIGRETNVHAARPAPGGIGRGVRSRGVLGGGTCAAFASALLAGADPVHAQTATIRYRVIHLGTIDGADDSAAYGINLFGQVTGVAGNAPFATPAVDGWLWVPEGSFTPNARTYEPGLVTPLAPTAASLASTNSRGYDLGDDGVVTGWFQDGPSADRLGFVWQTSLVMTGLPTGSFHAIGSLQSAPATVLSEGRAIHAASALFSNVAGFSDFSDSPAICEVAGLAWERNVAGGTESRTALMPDCSERSDARALGRNPSRVGSDDLVVELRRECGIGCASSLPCLLAVPGAPVVWVNGSTTPQALSLPATLDTLGDARDASDGGQIVGIGRQGGSKACLGHAVWWQDRGAVATDLHVAGSPPLPTGPNAQSEANAVNLLGQVVGADLESRTAQLWENPGLWNRTELDTVIADGDGVFVTPCEWEWQLQVARDINERGWIVGEGLWDETGNDPAPPRRAFLLIPANDACAADVDGDGLVGFDDVAILLAEWDSTECCDRRANGYLCPQDADGDGVVGFGDLSLVLLFWSHACTDLGPESAPLAMSLELVELWGLLGGREALEASRLDAESIHAAMSQPCEFTRFESLCGLLEYP